jgi:hypothetical protein
VTTLERPIRVIGTDVQNADVKTKDYMNEDLRKVSYSQYAMWSTCPQQWRLSYVDGLKPDDQSIHTIFGTAIHETIQTWLEKHYNGTPIQAKVFDTDTFLKERLIAGFTEAIIVKDEKKIFVCDQKTLMEFYADGLAIVNYVKRHKEMFFPSKGYELLGVEIPLEVVLNPHLRYVAYLDIVIRNKKTGVITILDLKTSKSGWFYEKKDPKKINQLLLYKKFFSDVYGVELDQIEVQFVILKRKVNATSEWSKRVSTFDPSQGNPSIKKAVASFETFLSETFDPNGFPRVTNLKPTPSESNCRFCPFKQRKDLCQEGFYK